MDGLDSFKAAIEKRKQLELADIKHEEGQVQTLQTQEIIAKSFKSLIDYLDNRVSKTAVVNQLQEIGTPDALKVVDSINQLHETIKTHENTDLTEITKVMNDLLAEAKQLPKELPTIPQAKDPKDYSKDFEKLTTAIKAVEKVVEAQELVAEAPVIPETQVNVEAPDLKPLQASIKDVVKAVKAIVIPEAKLDTQPVEKLLKKSNVLLNELLEKPVRGGGGGGSTWIATNSEGIPVPIELTVDGKIPVSGTVTTGGLTDTQLRASAVPVSLATAPTTPVTGTFWQATQPVSLASVPSHAVTNAGTFAVQAAQSGTWNVGTVTTLTGITNNVNTVEVAPTTVLNGNTDVTTAGTRVVLASSTTCKSVTIKAKAANTGIIYVGSSTVSSANGFALASGETVTLDIANLNTVNLDSSVNGEGVTYVGVN